MYTPCLQWPNCSRSTCYFRHPELNAPLSTQDYPRPFGPKRVQRPPVFPADATLPPGPRLYAPTSFVLPSTPTLLPFASEPFTYSVRPSSNPVNPERALSYRAFDRKGTICLTTAPTNLSLVHTPPGRSCFFPLSPFTPESYRHPHYDRPSPLGLSPANSLPSSTLDSLNESTRQVLAQRSRRIKSSSSASSELVCGQSCRTGCTPYERLLGPFAASKTQGDNARVFFPWFETSSE
jgi:hypothetical protein